MKTLYISGLCFKLPEDFKGSDADALRLMADYMEEVKHSTQAVTLATHEELDALKHGDVRKRIWADYWQGIGEGKHLCGDIQVSTAC